MSSALQGNVRILTASEGGFGPYNTVGIVADAVSNSVVRYQTE